MEEHDKSSRILQAAIRVFSEHGFHSATIEQIADQAGVGKGTVYLYFKSKEELFKALALHGLERAATACREIAWRYTDPRERLSQLATWHLQFIAHSLSMMQLVVQQALPQQMSDLRPEVEGYLVRFRDLYADTLQAGVDAGYFRPHQSNLVAVAIIGALNQVGLQSFERRSDLDLADARDEVLRLFISGIQKVGE